MVCCRMRLAGYRDSEVNRANLAGIAVIQFYGNLKDRHIQ